MPKPRYGFEGFRNFNKERLKKISLSSSSLPPFGLFPTEEKSKQIPAITDGLYRFENSDDNINEDYYDKEMIPAEYRHPSLEYFDDFYPIEHQFLFDATDDDEEGTNGPQMTTTTTIASFKCQTQTQQTSVTIYQQTHNRSSSL